MFKIVNNVIRITRGDTGIFSLSLKNAEGEAYDYSNDTVKFTVKSDVYSKTALIQKTVSYGETVTILPGDTAQLPYGEYAYDVQVTTQGGIVDTVIPPNKFIVMSEVTF